MKNFVSAFIAVMMLNGCATIATNELYELRDGFANDNFVVAADKYSNGADIQSQDSLQLMMTGIANFQAKNYQVSDDAFEEFNRRNYDTTGGSIIREAKTFLGGGLAAEYKPSMMDSLFVSYYQIWDAIGLGHKNDVRVIINQSYARQQEMSRAYADMVEKNQSRITDENKDLFDKIQQENATWGAYTDIMNPALMYLSGIWFLNSGDYTDAETYLKRAVGMAPKNTYIATDLKSAESKSRPNNTTWIFIESGFAPILHEQTISLPVITNNGIIVPEIAIAEPVFNNSNFSVVGAQDLADVNAMFMTEFNEYRINDALRAWSSAVARTIAQATAYNSNSKYAGLIGLGSTLFSISTTNAEVRSWVTLPEKISVIRVKTGDLIANNFNDKLGTDIKLPKSGNHLIYVRKLSKKPIVHIFDL